jgi:predicted TIM-barrel fold metal-dependent hydrolase
MRRPSRKLPLICILAASAFAFLGLQAARNWGSDPEWVKVRYGAWGGPGVDPRPGAMDAIALKDYAPKTSLIVAGNTVSKAKYPAIDVHTHLNAKTPADVREWVRTMDEVGIQTSIILTGATGEQFDKLVDLYLKPFPTRFQLYCGLDTRDMDKPDYPDRAAAELMRCYRKGARGVGELTDKGMGYSRATDLPREKRLHPDDPRLNAFWDKCAELKIPVNTHVADHPSCWQPLDVYQERTPDYQHFNLYGKDVPSHAELIAMRDRAMANHPKTTFIACHLGNQGHDLATLAKALDRYPNFNVDISARDYEIGRAPRTAAKFLAKYRSRVLFGTDMGREKSMFQAWWRLLESDDEFITGRMWWRYYGLELPGPVLESLYGANARRLLNWTPTT